MATRDELPPVPTGIQTLLRLASVDTDFRDQLVRRRAELAAVARVVLTDSERAILEAIPAEQLREMADKMPPPPPPRREFLRKTAATAVVLLGGAAVAGTLGVCNEPGPLRLMGCNPMAKTGGAAPDWPDDDGAPDDDSATGDDDSAAGDDDSAKEAAERLDKRAMDASGGEKADVPEERPDHGAMQTTGGAAPDLPPDRPKHPPMQTKGGAKPDLPEEETTDDEKETE